MDDAICGVEGKMLRNLITGLAALTLLGACVSEVQWTAIDAEAARFHERQANGEDSAILADASPGFRSNATLDAVARLNAAVRGAQGCSAPVRNTGAWHSNQTTSGHFVTATYTRQCAGGELVESLTFQMVGGAAQLHGYNASGMALFPATPTPDPTPAAAPESADAQL